MTQDEATKLYESGITPTKSQAVKFLGRLDHVFIKPEYAKWLSKPFDHVPTIETTVDNRSDFKGLHVPSVNEGDEVKGVSAHLLAEELCMKLNLDYQSMFGIGSQLSVCCEVLKKHLTTEGETC